MRLLIADSLPQAHIGRIEEQGHELTYDPGLASDDLARAVASHDVVIVRSTRVTAEAIEAGDGLRLVIRAGSGTDTIDRDAASRHGVAVCNVPGRNAIAVAELAFALLLAIDRDIPAQVADLRAGRWRKKVYQQATGIAGRHVGVVGLGGIGLAFGERAAAFACELYAVRRDGRAADVQERAEKIGFRFVDDLHEMARICDVLSFHVPMSDATRGLVGFPLLDHVRDGAILINTSRGDVVDEHALLEVIDDKQLRVGLDVYPSEPSSGEGSIDSALARHPRVTGTHHVGASTEQAQRAVADEVVEMIDAFGRGEIRHCVNPDVLDRIGARARP